MFLDMPLSRILQVYVLQLGMGIYLLIIGLVIIKRDTKRLNLILSGFFISIFIGTILNVIYAPLTNETIIQILNFFTYFLFCFAQIFLLVFNLIIFKSEKILTTKKQFAIIISFGLLIGVSFFIPNGIIISKSNNYIPQWSISFFLYNAIVCIALAIIPTLYTSIKIYMEMGDPQLKKKWIFYIIGICMYYTEWFGVSLCNYLNDPTISLIWNVFALSFFLCAYFIYYGVGQRIHKE